jgi:hypothetical protein
MPATTKRERAKPKAGPILRFKRKDGRLILVDPATGDEHDDLVTLSVGKHRRITLTFATPKPFLGKPSAFDVRRNQPASWDYIVPAKSIDLTALGL